MRFLQWPSNQAHEQNNTLVKGDGGAVGLKIYAEIVFLVVLINYVNSKLNVPQFTSKIKPENKLRIVCTTVWISERFSYI